MQIRSKTRSQVLEVIDLLASSHKQVEYERSVPHVFIPEELIEIYASDTFCPKSQDFISAFNESELKSLAWLYGLVCTASKASQNTEVKSVAELQKLPEWRAVINLSKDLLDQIKPTS